MALLTSSYRAGVTVESIKSILPEGVEVFHALNTGQMVFPRLDEDGNSALVAVFYIKPVGGTRPKRLTDHLGFPSPDEGVVTDPDGWKFRTVKLEANDARGQMKELAAAIEELVAP